MATGEPPSVEHGVELAALAQALTTHPGRSPDDERAALVAAAGPAVAERAIGVVATFQMMNRLLDGVGAPVRGRLDDVARILGFDPEDIPR